MARKDRSPPPPAKGDFIPCTIRALPEEQWLLAARSAIEENPANKPALERMATIAPGLVSADRQALAMLTSKYWGPGGVKLGVAFLDGGPADLQARILSHFNAWGQTANVVFLPASAGMAQVRVTRTPGDGYWSYLGTDILHVGKSEPTMNLDSFTMQTAEGEYRRVVRHECGHTLGCPHEHLRAAIIRRLDPAKTIAYFRQQYGWSQAMTQSNVLTPLEEQALIATPLADETSVMAYQLPGSITTDGRAVVGGDDINPLDASFVARLYPPVVAPPPPPPPGGLTITLGQDLAKGTYALTKTG